MQAFVSVEDKVNLPILQCHGRRTESINEHVRSRLTFCPYVGDHDPMVPLRWARASEQNLRQFGFKQYSFREYSDMGHAFCDRVRTRA